MRIGNGEPGLVDRVLALNAGSRGFDSRRGHMSERFFRSNRPRYPHPVSSELENSGTRVAVGDCSVTERRRWRPPYQTGKAVHVHAKRYEPHEDGCTAPGVCGNGSLSHSENVVTRIGIHTLRIGSQRWAKQYAFQWKMHGVLFKGRFLEFRRYHNFANLFSKLSESAFSKEISKFP